MSEQVILSPRRGLGRLLTCAGFAALAISGPANATVSLEYGQDYQDAYLEACMARESARLCSCEMVAIQEAMSFEVFAEAVQRTRGDPRTDAIWTASAPAIAANCPGVEPAEEE